jgi:hypothetical protein
MLKLLFYYLNLRHENNHVLLNENNRDEDDVSQNNSTSYSLFGFMEERINA